MDCSCLINFQMANYFKWIIQTYQLNADSYWLIQSFILGILALSLQYEFLTLRCFLLEKFKTLSYKSVISKCNSIAYFGMKQNIKLTQRNVTIPAFSGKTHRDQFTADIKWISLTSWQFDLKKVFSHRLNWK